MSSRESYVRYFLVSLVLHGITVGALVVFVHAPPGTSVNKISFFEVHAAGRFHRSAKTQQAPAPLWTLPSNPGPKSISSEVPAKGSSEKRGSDLPSGELNLYFLRLRSKIEQSLHYPQALRAQRVQGVVGVSLIIDPSGSLRSVEIKSPSGSEALDQSALKAVRDSAPFEAFEGASRSVQIPIRFSLKAAGKRN